MVNKIVSRGTYSPRAVELLAAYDNETDPVPEHCIGRFRPSWRGNGKYLALKNAARRLRGYRRGLLSMREVGEQLVLSLVFQGDPNAATD